MSGLEIAVMCYIMVVLCCTSCQQKMEDEGQAPTRFPPSKIQRNCKMKREASPINAQGTNYLAISWTTILSLLPPPMPMAAR
eukprot:scaffold6859_cov100-Skeletonema_marinoi.AAC.4